MLAPATMRLCNNAALALLLAGAAIALPAQQSPPPPQAPPLTVDRDPVRSPDLEPPVAAEPLNKQGKNYVLHAEVEEVVLNCTVLEGNRLVPDLKKEDFKVFEDGVQQKIVSFQHTDLPVSIAMVVHNSGSMSRKRPSASAAPCSSSISDGDVIKPL